MITATGFGFRHASRKAWALRDVSFHIAPGEKVLLLGGSGSGKSTLLAAIAGLEEEGQRHGTLHTGGVVGMVLQDPDAQVIAARVGDDVAFGCENRGMSDIWPRVSTALAMVGLDLPLDYPTAKLSGGQKQRLALAGVLAMGAEVILLDEPTANLDPQGVAEVVAAVEAATTQATVVIVEHRVGTWSHVVDRALVLGEGGGITSCPVAELGEDLAAAGVWIPGHDPQFPPLPAPSGEVAMEFDCACGWKKEQVLDHQGVIPLGGSTVITGPNGAGKSTLMLTLAGLLTPIAGSVRLHPSLGEGEPWRWKSQVLASRFGYVFQDPEHQFIARTVREELRTTDERAEEVLGRLRLDHLAAANPFTLSGGQKRRLSVAAALVQEPAVLFLDEPTFGQDRQTFTELVTLLRSLREGGTTVVSISHDELYLAAMADHHVEVGV